MKSIYVGTTIASILRKLNRQQLPLYSFTHEQQLELYKLSGTEFNFINDVCAVLIVGNIASLKIIRANNKKRGESHTDYSKTLNYINRRLLRKTGINY